MSNNIPGRGKQRKHGQDLNSNAMPMGGGQMAMPPNSAASTPFVTPIISQPHALAAPDYGRPHYGGVEVQHLQQPPVSGSHNPMMVLPNGMNVQQEQPSQYANMQGLPQNMRGAGNNPNMQWQNPQQTQMAMHGGMAPNQMNRGAPQQNRGGYTQQAQPMGYYAVPQPQGYPYMQPYMFQQQQQAAYAAANAQQQQQYYQPMMGMMQQQQPGVAPMTMQAPPALQQQQQQQGGAAGGVAAAGAAMGGVPTSQQQSMHGGSPSSGVQPMHNGAVPVTTPSGVVPQSAFNPAMRAAQLQQQQQQTVAAPVAPKKKNVLLIVDAKKAIHEEAFEESKKEEDAPKSEKEEAKGTGEPDSAAPVVKKQFTAQILEQTTKSDQPAPAPIAAPPVKERKCFFSFEQMMTLGLEVAPHTPTPTVATASATHELGKKEDKIENSVIADAASQDEGESEPSTPAPVTPSVSETAATLAEEEEDEGNMAAVILKEKQLNRAELEAEIAMNGEDIEQEHKAANLSNQRPAKMNKNRKKKIKKKAAKLLSVTGNYKSTFDEMNERKLSGSTSGGSEIINWVVDVSGGNNVDDTRSLPRAFEVEETKKKEDTPTAVIEPAADEVEQKEENAETEELFNDPELLIKTLPQLVIGADEQTEAQIHNADNVWMTENEALITPGIGVSAFERLRIEGKIKQNEIAGTEESPMPLLKPEPKKAVRWLDENKNERKKEQMENFQHLSPLRQDNVGLGGVPPVVYQQVVSSTISQDDPDLIWNYRYTRDFFYDLRDSNDKLPSLSHCVPPAEALKREGIYKPRAIVEQKIHKEIEQIGIGSSYSKTTTPEPSTWTTIGKLRYNKSDKLGRGCNGTFVYSGEYEERREVAVKRVILEHVKPVVREVEILRSRADSLPNIIRYFCSEYDENFHYIALELCVGSLVDLVNNSMREPVVIPSNEIVKQIANGLKFLHSYRIVHRDLKPANVLLSKSREKPTVLISDFGCSKRQQLERHSITRTSELSGTDGYIAPEELNRESTTFPMDIFSWGCVSYYVLTGGYHPYGDDRDDRNYKVRNGSPSLDELDMNKDNLSIHLILWALNYSPSDRPTPSAILAHPFFWDTNQVLDFFFETSEHLHSLPYFESLSQSVESCREEVIGNKKCWMDLICPPLRKYLNSTEEEYGKYNDSVRSLLRLIRNMKSHHGKLPWTVRNSVGEGKEGIARYFAKKFPKLLLRIHQTMKPCSNQPRLREFYTDEDRECTHR